MSKLESQPLPSSKEAEQALLGCVLIEPDCLKLVAQRSPLVPSDFYDDSNKYIWKAMGAILKRNETPDLVTVKDELQKDGNLDKVGGAYVSSLLNAIPNVNMAADYAKIIREKRAARDVIHLFVSSIDRLYSDGVAVVEEEVIKGLKAIASTLPNGGGAPINITYAAELMSMVKGQVEWQKENGIFFTGIRTGYEKFDKILGGWQRGVLHILAAYTSHSKSASLLDFSIAAAKAQEDSHSIYFTLEMTEMMMGRRLLASQGGVSLLKLKEGRIYDSAWDRFTQAADEVSSLGKRWSITDAMVGIEEIERTCVLAKAEHGLDVIFVDYLQLVEDDDEKNREREVNKIAKRLLDMAKRLDIAVVASAQLNEGVVNRKNHRPLLTDIRESRAVNQHARTVILLSRPWLFERTEVEDENETQHSPCTLIYYVEKNSEGELGEFPLHYNLSHQQIREEDCTPECYHYRPPLIHKAKEKKEYEQSSF
jgi:replicative DNA helicase